MDSSDGEDAMSEPCSDTDQEIAEDSGTAQLVAPTVSSLCTYPHTPSSTPAYTLTLPLYQDS